MKLKVRILPTTYFLGASEVFYFNICNMLLYAWVKWRNVFL